MHVILDIDPSQLFAGHRSVQEVHEIVNELLKRYRDDYMLWEIVCKVLDTLVTDYQLALEWYTESQLQEAFEGKSPTDPEFVNESQLYLDAAVKVLEMAKAVRDGNLQDVR